MNQATPEASDAELVRRAKAGELDAFEALTNRYEQRVYSLALRMLRQEQDAEDVTQQTFLSALEHLRGLSRRRQLRHLAAAHRHPRGAQGHPQAQGPATPSRWRKRPKQPDRLRHHPAPGIHRGLAAVAGGTGAEAMKPSVCWTTRWRNLDEKHRLVFLLRDVEGLSVKETAEALGLSEANTKVRLLRAQLATPRAADPTLGDPARRVVRRTHDH